MRIKGKIKSGNLDGSQEWLCAFSHLGICAVVSTDIPGGREYEVVVEAKKTERGCLVEVWEIINGDKQLINTYLTPMEDLR